MEIWLLIVGLIVFVGGLLHGLYAAYRCRSTPRYSALRCGSTCRAFCSELVHEQQMGGPHGCVELMPIGLNRRKRATKGYPPWLAERCGPLLADV